MWRILNTLFRADYERIEFTILAPRIEVAPNCTQSELTNIPRGDGCTERKPQVYWPEYSDTLRFTVRITTGAPEVANPACDCFSTFFPQSSFTLPSCARRLAAASHASPQG